MQSMELNSHVFLLSTPESKPGIICFLTFNLTPYFPWKLLGNILIVTNQDSTEFFMIFFFWTCRALFCDCECMVSGPEGENSPPSTINNVETVSVSNYYGFRWQHIVQMSSREYLRFCLQTITLKVSAVKRFECLSG